MHDADQFVIDDCHQLVDRHCRLASPLLLSRSERTQLNAFSGLCNPLATSHPEIVFHVTCRSTAAAP
jgi:hypothetical protein